jgi:hypothetical protein
VPKHELDEAEAGKLRLEIEEMCHGAATDPSTAAPLVLGTHRAEMVTTDSNDSWVADNGTETYERAVCGSVFSPFPRPVVPLVVTFYRWWCRLRT